MSSIKSNKEEQKRREHNGDLIRRMKDGETLTSFDSTSSWFPPRPIVKKDQRAIERLYREEAIDDQEKTGEERAESGVIPLRRAN